MGLKYTECKAEPVRRVKIKKNKKGRKKKKKNHNYLERSLFGLLRRKYEKYTSVMKKQITVKFAVHLSKILNV